MSSHRPSDNQDCSAASGREGVLLCTTISQMTAAVVLQSEKGCFPVSNSRIAMAYEYVSASIVGVFPSINSGAIHRALPPAVNVAEALFSVTSSMTFDIPKSQIQASP
ncbi:hypothetical protein CVT25_015521 [Psilocybe cyanescens]|uniref:Uncharacterized protein n=1 Tax=Psilocybe cyanescens TaxID=93625 RepID=A0A409WI21_PSICY|nr:hypothetical protein CVT25_015521 [Psilocybe cyanescens]